MSSFYVEFIGAEKFQNAEQMLADVPGGMERALKSATKRAVSFLRTQSYSRRAEHPRQLPLFQRC